MSSRLSSFRGPSKPTSSPVQSKRPTTPLAESTHHRQTRSILQDLRSAANAWDDIVAIEGLRRAESLVNKRTTLENILSSLPEGQQPDLGIMEPSLRGMDEEVELLDNAILKLQQQKFQKMNKSVEQMETLFHETYQAKGWEVVQRPLWATWSLEKFALALPSVLTPYHRSLQMHIEIVDILRSHDVSSEASRKALTRMAAEPFLAEDGWDNYWEDICKAEVARWNGEK